MQESDVESIMERLYLAVLHLATGAGDVRDRLLMAADDLFVLSDEEFPEYLQDDFKWIKEQMTKFKSEGDHESDVDVTMRQINNSTGQEIAHSIFGMYRKAQENRGYPMM